MHFGQNGVALQTMEQALIFAKAVIDGGWAPKDFKTPQAVLVAMQFGAELGLPPMTALSSIAVINGRPSIWGDAMKAIVDASGLLEDYKDDIQPTFARVTVKRRGNSEPIIRTFSIDDARKAGLWGKAGPWTSYPQRMLLMRARSWALRDGFSDVLKGCMASEEARDIPPEPRNVTPPAPVERLSALDAPKLETLPVTEDLFQGDEQIRADIEASKAKS